MHNENPSPLLQSRWAYHASVALLTFMYWGSGFQKLFDFSGTLGEMAHFNLAPPAFFAVATIIVQLAGSALLIAGGRFAWVGAAALAAFTVATIPVAHRFWELEGMAAFLEKMVVLEHITVVGGLFVAAVAASYHRRRS
ncbi:MAG: DoxX family protein [Pseudomonadota bacterium]